MRFQRGDQNADGKPNLSDAVFTLGWLFQTGAAPGCQASADANADGKVDISDPIYLLTFLLLGGPEPAAPFPECEPEPQSLGLGCEVSCQ